MAATENRAHDESRHLPTRNYVDGSTEIVHSSRNNGAEKAPGKSPEGKKSKTTQSYEKKHARGLKITI
ncbi:unnamed protein product [Nesidiocoris tenuis]|uniref:Uncharacterized protein n=1 Tax=Nesidiocoris tenuis TaxID=355587 RepID=A0A6H5H6V5_9HEMI|nr:unnamed protein product [Nesidiocoris tenuis]